jgi:hypothetical protein
MSSLSWHITFTIGPPSKCPTSKTVASIHSIKKKTERARGKSLDLSSQKRTLNLAQLGSVRYLPQRCPFQNA